MENPNNAGQMVRMRRDRGNVNRYNCILDLGDPDHMANISGEYELVVLLGDIALHQQVRQKVMRVSVSYKRGIERVPSPLDYQTLEEIQHTFQPSPRHPNVLVTYVFLALLLLVTGYYLVSACSLGNSKRLLPAGLCSQLSFWLTLLLWLALLIAFWVFINLK